jgi:hypothetical protein
MRRRPPSGLAPDAGAAHVRGCPEAAPHAGGAKSFAGCNGCVFVHEPGNADFNAVIRQTRATTDVQGHRSTADISVHFTLPLEHCVQLLFQFGDSGTRLFG